MGLFNNKLKAAFDDYVLYNKEIDFVALKKGQRIYIQVSDDIQRSETQPKGVKIVDIARWLTEEGD